MEGIFWLLLIFLAVLSGLLALTTAVSTIGAILIFRSRGNQRRRSEARVGVALVVIGALPFLCICLNTLASLPNVVPRLSYLPHAVDPGASQVQAMLAARLEAGAEEKCFGPIEPTARFEMNRTYGDEATYDIMLSVYGPSSRTIAFKEQNGAYQWLGEQETFTGPNQYLTSSGYSSEQITISFDTVYLSGAPLNAPFIRYSGEDPRLASRMDLTCEDVQPVLLEWEALRQD